jgi:pimeloyl-CoA synthetase
MIKYMNNAKFENIKLEKLSKEIEQYENLWIAISSENRIMASGRTYKETLKNIGEDEEVILFKVPPLNVSFAPFYQ